MKEGGETVSLLKEHGFIPEVATKVSVSQKNKVADMASRVNMGERVKYLALHPDAAWRAFNTFAAKVGNAGRVQAAYGTYLRAKRLHPELTEDQLWDAAAKAGNEVLGNFRNVSKTAVIMEGATPYSGATQAGYRAMIRRFREAPVETTLKTAALLGPIGFFTYTQMQDYKDYYDQKIKSGNTNDLDSNMVIMLPSARYDKDTNQWKGVIKIPVAPDFKPLQRAAWRTAYNLANGDAPDTKMIANEMLSFMTADYGSNIYNTKTHTPLPGSPVTKMIQIGAGYNPSTGKKFNSENYEASTPRTERVSTNTSGFAKNFSKFTNGFLTPQQTDAVLNQLGFYADILQTGENNSGKNKTIVQAVTQPFISSVYGSTGFSDKQESGKAYSEKMNKVITESGMNENQVNLFKGLIKAKSKDPNGNDISAKSFWDTSANANVWLKDIQGGDGKLWEASKRIYEETKKPGTPDDPLYSLDKDKLLVVLGMMANPSPGNYDEKGTQKLNPWIKDFYKQRSEYFDAIAAANPSANNGKDYTGTTIPKADKNLQGKINALSAMPKEGKAQFMKDNPDIADYFAAQDAYQRYKRSIMGPPQFDKYPTASPEVQKAMDEYNSLPKGNGPVSKTTGKTTSPDRSAWIKSHPNEWAAMTEQWYKQNLYNLQGDAALAVYEGIDIPQETLDKFGQGTSSGYSNGYGRFGYNKNSSSSSSSNEPQINLSSYISKISPSSIKDTQIDETTPKNVKFKVKKLPKTSTKARIKLY